MNRILTTNAELDFCSAKTHFPCLTHETKHFSNAVEHNTFQYMVCIFVDVSSTDGC